MNPIIVELNKRGMGAAALTEKSGLPLSVCQRITLDREQITREVAEGLTKALGMTVEFWVALGELNPAFFDVPVLGIGKSRVNMRTSDGYTQGVECLIAIPAAEPASINNMVMDGNCQPSQMRDWCKRHPMVTLKELRKLCSLKDGVMRDMIELSKIFERLKACGSQSSVAD